MAAADLGETEEAGPRVALEFEGKGGLSAGPGEPLNGGCAWDLGDRHDLYLDVDVGGTSRCEGLPPQAKVEEEVDHRHEHARHVHPIPGVG